MWKINGSCIINLNDWKKPHLERNEHEHLLNNIFTGMIKLHNSNNLLSLHSGGNKFTGYTTNTNKCFHFFLYFLLECSYFCNVRKFSQYLLWMNTTGIISLHRMKPSLFRVLSFHFNLFSQCRSSASNRNDTIMFIFLKVQL